MPRIAHRATFSATSYNFTLHLAVHHLVSSQTLQHDEMSKIPPSNVLAQNPLLFTLSGSNDGILATHDELVTSKTTNHLVGCLRKNLLRLGLDSVSEITVHQDRDIPGFTVTFGHAKAIAEFVPAQPILQSLHLDFAWKTRQIAAHKNNTSSSDLRSHPFSKDLTLPLQTLLDEVVTRFVKNNLVRRYPFIFGDLARQLINETAYFSPIITAITRIIKRSVNPAFRSQCGELLKLLGRRHDRLYTIADQQQEMRGCQSSMQSTTGTAFCLAMQNVIKTGMKCTAFKSAHGYIMDIEEQELLEPEPRLMDIPGDPVSHLPLEDLFLDQEEDVSGLGQRRSSFSGLLCDSQPGVRLLHTSPPATVELPLDTDSEGESDLVELDDLPLAGVIGIDEIAFDLDEPDEDEFYMDIPERSPTERVAKLSSQSHSLPLLWQYCLNNSLGGNGSSSFRTEVGFYVEITPGPIPQDANKGQESVHRSGPLNLMTSHATQQARSGDTGSSRGKGNMNHMGDLELWRNQVAPKVMVEIPTRASLSSNLERFANSLDEENELPLNTDSDLEEDVGRWTPILEEARSIALKREHGLTANPKSNASSHTCYHRDFLDVLSEELCLDDERDLSNQDTCGMVSMFTNMDCIKERDTITGSMTQLTQHVDIMEPSCGEAAPVGVFSELVDEEMVLKDGCNEGFAPQNEATLLLDHREELDGWSDNEDESLFIELIT